MARFTVTRRNEQSSYIDPVSMTISLTNEELQTFTNALQPTGYSECIIQQLLDLINPPIASEKTEQEESNWLRKHEGKKRKEWMNEISEKYAPAEEKSL